MITWIVLAVVFLVFVFVVAIYNKLVKLKNMVEEAWSGIDVQLKKRYSLIPNLVNTIKGYATHEKEVFENVSAMRSAGMNAKTVAEHNQAENGITQALGPFVCRGRKLSGVKSQCEFPRSAESIDHHRARHSTGAQVL